jgi:hypothetical protein
VKPDPTTLFEVFRREGETMKRNERSGGTTVEIFQGKDGNWYFRTKARNRQVGDVSEGYRRKSSAVRGATRWHPGIPQVILKAATVLVLALALFAAPVAASPITLGGSSAWNAWASPVPGSGAFWANVSYDRNGQANVGYYLGTVPGSDVPNFLAGSPGGTPPYLGTGGTTFGFDLGYALDVTYLQGVTGWPDSEFGLFPLGDPGTLFSLVHTRDPKGILQRTGFQGQFGFYLTSRAGTWRSTSLDRGRSHFAFFQGDGAWYLGIEDAPWDAVSGINKAADWDYNDMILKIQEPTPVPEPGSILMFLTGLGFVGGLRRRWGRK